MQNMGDLEVLQLLQPAASEHWANPSHVAPRLIRLPVGSARPSADSGSRSIGVLTRVLRQLATVACPVPEDRSRGATNTAPPGDDRVYWVTAPAAGGFQEEFLSPASDHWRLLVPAADSVPQSGEPAASAAAPDRRAFPRRLSGCTVSVCRRDQEPSLTEQRVDWLLHAESLRGRVRDISMNGVAFVLAQSLTNGEQVSLRLRNRQRDWQIDVSGRVVRVTETANGRWRIQCRFDRKLTYEQIHLLGQSLAASVV